jgi:hypothetical protein
VELVHAGARGHVDDTAAGASHLRVVRVDLHLHFLHRFHARIGRGAVLEVGHRKAIHEVVVRADRAAAHRDGGVADLILHAVPVRVAAGLHRRFEVGEQEEAPSRGRNGLQGLRVDHAAGRGVRRVDERRLAGDRDRLFDRADFEIDVDGDELLRADHNPFALERSVAAQHGQQTVHARIDGGKCVLAGAVRHGIPRDIRLIVNQHHCGARHDAARVFHSAAQSALKRLRASVDDRCGDDAKHEHQRHSPTDSSHTSS